MTQLLKNAPPLRPIGVQTDRRIGQILLDSGRLKPEDGERILRLQKEKGLRFGEAAKQLGLVTEEDIQRVLSEQFDYPYLLPGTGMYSAELVAAYEPFSPQVEALRALRSQLMLRWFGPHQKALVIVGAHKQDGISYLAANLAIVFSQLGERTLLIDADLRSPKQHEMFKLGNRRGLSDVLAGNCDMSVAEHIPEFVDLSVLAAGTVPPNPQELLGRPAFAELLAIASAEYDVVLIEAAPGASSADAQMIAARAQGAMVVARAQHSRVSELAALKRMLVRSGAELIGTVLSEI